MVSNFGNVFFVFVSLLRNCFVGVAPPSFIAIEAGKTLYKMTSSSDAFSSRSIATLTVFSVLALVPVVFKRYFKSKID